MATDDWEYSRIGGWKKIDVRLFGQSADDTSLESILASRGYQQVAEYGHDKTIELWEHQDLSPRWLVSLGFPDSYKLICCPETPDMIELMAKLSPIAIADLLGMINGVCKKVDIIAEDHESWKSEVQRQAPQQPTQKAVKNQKPLRRW